MSKRLALIAVLGLALFLLSLAFDPKAALRGWLVAAVGWSAVSLGCLILLLIRRLTEVERDGGVGPALAAAGGTVPLVGLGFLPVLLALAWIYPWVEVPPHGAFKLVWLTPWFFALRSVVYFLAWALAARMRAVPGLLVLGLTGSLAAVDWLMSLEPDFHSAVFGAMFLSHAALAGWSFAVAATYLGEGQGPPDIPAGFIIAGVLLWAYMAFCQYLVIWSANQPEEIAWYLLREAPPWGGLYWASSLLEGILPFLFLLPKRLRANRRMVGLMGAAVVAGGIMEVAVMALPVFGPSPVPAVSALAAVIGLGGLWLLVFAHRMGEAKNG